MTKFSRFAAALVPRATVTVRRCLEEIADDEEAAGLEQLLDERQRIGWLDVLKALAEQDDIVARSGVPDGKVLEATLEDLRLIPGALPNPLPDKCAEVLGWDDAVGEEAAVEHLADEVPRAAAHVEHAHFTGCRRELRENEVAVALLSDTQVPEGELEIRVPETVVQILDVPQLLREHKTKFTTVH
jgi:hypothetical protein